MIYLLISISIALEAFLNKCLHMSNMHRVWPECPGVRILRTVKSKTWIQAFLLYITEYLVGLSIDTQKCVKIHVHQYFFIVYWYLSIPYMPTFQNPHGGFYAWRHFGETLNSRHLVVKFNICLFFYTMLYIVLIDIYTTKECAFSISFNNTTHYKHTHTHTPNKGGKW